MSNILLIMTDDQPYHTLGLMNQVMGRIVSKGTRFSNGYVATPVCGPARGSVLTGLYSHHTGLTGTKSAFREILARPGLLERGIAPRLKDAGYTTFHTGKFTNGLGEESPTDYAWKAPGYDYWYAQLEDLNKGAETYWSENTESMRTVERGGGERNETMIATRYAEAFIREQREPWFLCFWPHSPHGPYQYLSRFEGTHQGEEPPTLYGEKDLSDKAQMIRSQGYLTRPERMHDYREKLREIEDVDVGVGILLDVLEETGQLDNTFIFYLTDNGYQFGEHDLDKKDVGYEESTRTPFVIRGLGISRDVVRDELVSQIDLLPTICTLAGADPSGTDGLDILSSFASPRDDLLIEAEDRGWWALRTRDNFLYVLYRDGWEELYDYTDDPYLLDGTVNTPRERERVAELSTRLEFLKNS